MTLRDITAGFIPLIDASILITAREKGFAEEQNINLVLMRETSWATIRDRLAIGHFDVAHMLAPMPIAANLGLTPFDMKLVAPMALGLGGNAVTVSEAKFADLFHDASPAGPGDAGRRLSRLIERRKRTGETHLKFGIVHPHSAHNLELRYWLAASNIDPDKDVELVVLPPSLMADAVAAGRIDGYCVGEPWNSVAVSKGIGRVITTKPEIWASSPEKVLGVPERLIQTRGNDVCALIRALHDAAKWCGNRANWGELSDILARSDYLGIEAGIIKAAIQGPANYSAFEKAATFPWRSHGLWFYSQMVRWGMIEASSQAAKLANETYRPDFYRRALRETDAVIPTASSKVEGALTSAQPVGATGGDLILGPDGFFDGKIFDPDHVEEYIHSQSRD